MGYEYVLVIPVILFVGMVCMHYTKKFRNKFMLMFLTFGIAFFYSFVKPGIFGIKKKPPYIYWLGNKKSNLGKKFDFSFRKMMEKLGFEFVD